MRKFAILIVWLAACHSPEKKITLPDDNAKIKNLLISEFNLASHHHPDVDSALKHRTSPDKEVILYPGGYKLRQITVYTKTYYPFVVKVSNARDSLLFLFTFADEQYYLNDGLGVSFETRETVKVYKPEESLTPSLYKRDMEENLNALIAKLGYQRNRKAIDQLIEALFKDLLKMKPFNEHELRSWNSFFSKIKTNDPMVKQSIQEYVDLEKKYNGEPCVSAKQGGFGYWLFTYEEENGIFKVKVRFISELFYFNVYW